MQGARFAASAGTGAKPGTQTVEFRHHFVTRYQRVIGFGTAHRVSLRSLACYLVRIAVMPAVAVLVQLVSGGASDSVRRFHRSRTSSRKVAVSSIRVSRN